MAKFFMEFKEKSGLDIIPHLFGKELYPKEIPEKQEVIKLKIKWFEENKIDKALIYSSELLIQENYRCETIESKAQNLMGITGIIASFLIGTLTLLFNKVELLTPLLLYIVTVLYITALISLIVTLFIAFKVVKVGKAKFKTLDINDVYKMGTCSLSEDKINRLSEIMEVFGHNEIVHNDKGTYLIGAQKWFRNSIVILLLLIVTLVVTVAASQNKGNNTSTIMNSNQTIISPTIEIPIGSTSPIIAEPAVESTNCPNSSSSR